jgi:phage-related tail protein
MALDVALGDPDLSTKAFADLKAGLMKEKAALEKAQTEVETLNRAVGYLKISADRFAT